MRGCVRNYAARRLTARPTATGEKRRTLVNRLPRPRVGANVRPHGGMPMYANRLWTLGFLLTGVAYGTAIAADSAVAERITGEAVTAAQKSKGVVLLAVRWDRRWKCAGFENAQLRVIGFDKL